MEEILKNLISKISSYNIFNNLLPGIIFVQMVQKILGVNILSSTVIENIFIYYFFGMVISRIGSLIVEEFLKFIGFIEFAPYEDYLEAEKKDKKLAELNETNNVYRTFASLFLSIIAVLLLNLVKNKEIILIVCLSLLFLLFIFSYKKQIEYIKMRIKKFKSN